MTTSVTSPSSPSFIAAINAAEDPSTSQTPPEERASNAASEDHSWSLGTLLQRIHRSYQQAIAHFVVFLTEKVGRIFGIVIGTILTEPLNALRAAWNTPYGWGEKFSYYGLNPENLSAEQRTQKPLLLIHGNYHNQSGWLSFAKTLQESYKGPVFTVNLPSGQITDADYAIVERKIEEITRKYLGAKNVRINLVGHSRGGYVASFSAFSYQDRDGARHYGHNPKVNIHKVISIGNVLSENQIHDIQSTISERNFPSIRSLFEITGEFDVLVREKSHLPVQQHAEFSTGHLGLLYSVDVHHRVLEVLNESSKVSR